MSGPRVVHVMTQKGKGFAFAENNQEKWHGLAAYDPVTGEARKKASGPPTWTQVFGDGLTALGGRAPRARGDHRRDAERAPAPTSSRRSIPERFFDVGIAEGHAVTFAGGLATQGIRPVVRDLQHVPPARLRQHHPRRRRAAPAGDLLHGPRGAGGRGRPDPHGPVRHRLHAGGAGHDGDRAQGRRRADRPAADGAGAHRRPVLHPLSARQGARPSRGPRPRSRRCRTAPGSGSAAGKDVAILAVGTMVLPARAGGRAAGGRRDRLRRGQLPLPQAARPLRCSSRCSRSTARW